jgi:ubiquinone/menaquinone biosynthesis C-methylase UbiE
MLSFLPDPVSLRGQMQIETIFLKWNFAFECAQANMAQERLAPARGETIIDLSCGPGGFTRRFLVGGEYKTVIAADYSLAMLEQCRGFLEDDPSADLS